MKNIHLIPTDKPSRLVKFFTNKFGAERYAAWAARNAAEAARNTAGAERYAAWAARNAAEAARNTAGAERGSGQPSYNCN